MVEMRGAGAVRGGHARRRHLRPRRVPAGDPGDHRTGRARRQGALGAARAVARRSSALAARVDALARAGDRRGLSGAASSRRATTQVGAAKKAVVEALAAEGLDAEQGQGACSRTWKPTSSATPSWTPACASTAATPRPCARSSPKSACCRAPMARALFTRGETQALCVATLGTGQDEQIIDALEGEYREHFMLHYNFPPYSVGEAGRMGSPGRREIGHGKLAWRAVHPLLPDEGEVPLHAARGLRDHREQRLLLDGDGLRHLAGADGCRRAAEAAGGRHRHGPDQGRSRLRRAVRHPGRRGPSRRHGLQGGRHRAGRHQRCRWTSRSPPSRRRSCRSRWTRRRTAGCTSWARWPRRSPARATTSPRPRRASPSSTCRRRRSAK